MHEQIIKAPRAPHDDLGDAVAGVGGAAIIVAAFLSPFLRNARCHWGIDEATAARQYPGDELIPEPRWGWTHGVEIDAPAAAVWPWIAQIGADRGGFYSYQWLENLVGCHVQNAETVHPEWEARVGDPLVLHPAPEAPRLEFVAVESGRYLLAQGRVDEALRAASKPWTASSWLFLVEPLDEGRCRFVSRFRAECSDDLATRLSFGPTLLEPVGFAMDRRMLLGVKQRAERAERPGSGRSSFRSIFAREAAHRLEHAPSGSIVTAADLAHLPPALQKYLDRSGVVGHARVENFHARFRGEIRRSPDADWMRIEAEQYSFYPEKARLFFLHASLLGIPFDALHLYLGPHATMQVKVASLFRVVDARGPEMNQGETVTMFNDMCLMAPATLIDPSIRWQELDARTVKGTFTNAGNTISALLSFDEAGDLVNFVSDDRYLSADGKTYEKFRWSTPIEAYGTFDARRVVSRASASWQMPNGELVYGRFEVVSIDYNVGPE